MIARPSMPQMVAADLGLLWSNLLKAWVVLPFNAYEREMLKCRFCNYKVRKFRTTAQGKVYHGFQDIKWHIESNHPAEFERIYGEPA